MISRFTCRFNPWVTGVSRSCAAPLGGAATRRNAERILSQQALRAFSTTSSRQVDERNNKTHYDVLGISTAATPAEIKKQFYALSRSTHPDMHPNDPEASARFSEISNSYHILSDPDKRARYDRDVIHLRQRVSGPPPGHQGSYAGSRPPSGLSKRRTTFRGPPPSFYSQGGYGSTSNSTSGPQAGTRPNRADRGNVNDTETGPRQFTDQPINRDYDSAPTQRTQSAEDTRRMSRRQAALAAAQAEMTHSHDFWVRVIVVMGIFVGAAAVGGMVRGKRLDDDHETQKKYPAK